MEYEEIEEELCNFERYLRQTMDLLKDAYRWRTMAKYCDDSNMKEKYMMVSNTLFELFMNEHNAIGSMFKEESR